MASGPVYRLRQFRRAVGARPSQAGSVCARRLLNDAEWQLFAGMAPRDQWHAIETLRLLGPPAKENDLAVAALLHDAGKGFVRLYERVLFVLLGQFPGVLGHLAAPNGAGWRAALYHSARHAETGAELALAAGASLRTAMLIRTHHQPLPSDPAALALHDADERA